jgi:molybdopterin-synthase adenylyltransferase
MYERYSRQILFDGIGSSGQEQLRESRVTIIGCGALGSAQAEMLARAGVGYLRIVDRDFVEVSNLQRQTMFTEHDASERIPKAAAAVKRIKEINSDIKAEAEILDVNRSNIERLIIDADLVLDGTDNFSTRYLINEACIKHKKNWIYGAAVGSYGLTMVIRPYTTPCLRCIFDEPPPPASSPTCDTAGVIMPIIYVVAALQISEALKLLTGQLDNLHQSLMQFDLWRNEWRRVGTGRRSADCQTCGLNRFDLLDADVESESVAVLCGRNAVQISPSILTTINLIELAERLRKFGEVKVNQYLLKFNIEDYELTIFKDARLIVRGTDDETKARSLYAKYVGI